MESAPRFGFFEARSPGPPIPRSTLQPAPHDASCKTWGQDGFALSFLVGLLHSQQYAGLSRRSTANPVFRPQPASISGSLDDPLRKPLSGSRINQQLAFTAEAPQSWAGDLCRCPFGN